MTSNLGAQALSELPSESRADSVKDLVMQEVRASFRPEFLNRLDEIILFERLTPANMGRIVDIQLRLLEKRLEDKGLSLSVEDGAKAWLASKGYDPAYGARPLKRVIQDSLQNPLAQALLSGFLKDGDTVRVRDDGENGLAIGNSDSVPMPPTEATLH